MKSIVSVAILILLCISISNAQSNQQITLASAVDSTFPSWNYSNYLNNDTTQLVPLTTDTSQVYSTVIVTLSAKSIISKVSLYDYDSTYVGNPAYVYAINGKDTTYLGKYIGNGYHAYIDINAPFPIVATKIAVRKCGNNFPRKLSVYGRSYTSGDVLDSIPDRIKVDTIIPSLNTTMNYTPWMTDSLSSMVQSVWVSQNNQYVDVRLQFHKRSQVSSIRLYDYTGVFTTNPAYIYLLKDTTLTLITTFTGPYYQTWTSTLIPEPMQADAIVVRKYGNNIPQKVQAYGRELLTDPLATPPVIVPTAPPPPPPAPSLANKIPIDAKRWFSLTNVKQGMSGLFNGSTTDNISTGFPSWMPVYESLYPLDDSESIKLKQIKLYDSYGTYASNPAEIFVVKKDGSRCTIATFTGSQYQTWVGPYPSRNITDSTQFNLDSTITNIQYIGIKCTNNNLPTEVEFYGDYTAPATKTIPARNYAPFSNTLGVNGFEWDFVSFTNSTVINESKYGAIKNFRGFRQYLDWKQLEEKGQGQYTFNPAFAGGWNYDMTYERCKRDSICILPAIVNIPTWMLNTYPDSLKSTDNNPMKYGLNRTDPASYIEKARVAFQFAGRYGRNANVPDSLMSVYGVPRWTADPVNVVKKGLGYVNYMEAGNEMDKWWKGIYGYMNPYELAAYMSAFYDGNKNTMGPGVGVKNADSTMLVVMPGLANANANYVRGMIEWCRMNRGYKADGSINLCWDVINYHHYSNDGGASQSGTWTRGEAPELSGADSVAKSFVSVAEKYANSMPVWVTELGYDINQGSSLRAIPIGSKTEQQTQADWILRSSLMYLRNGIQRLYFYELKDANLTLPWNFCSMGLTDTLYQRKLAGDYLYQTNQLIGNYKFAKTLQQSPIIDEYQNGTDSVFAVWVPDNKGTQMQCSLYFPNADSAIIYTPTAGSDNMQAQTVALNNGVLQITATETPVFIKAFLSSNLYAMLTRREW